FYQNERRARAVLPTYPFERERYWIDPVAARRARQASAADSGRRSNPDDWFYAPAWMRSPSLAPFETGALRDGKWLIFADQCGLGEAIAGRVREAGGVVNLVRPGARFAKAGDDGYIVNPASSEDYLSLFKALVAKGHRPTR